MSLERKVPPPIPNKVITDVRSAIKRMEDKQLALAKQPFAFSELLALFIDPADHQALLRTYELCEPSGLTQELFYAYRQTPELGSDFVHLKFHWHGTADGAFYVPLMSGGQRSSPATMREEAPDELRSRLRMVVNDLTAIHLRFYQVRWVLDRLNRASACRTLAALRYHWPCIVPILRSAGYSPLAESVAEPVLRAGDSASIPIEVRRKLADTNRTVASHMLIDDLPMPPPMPVSYELQHNFR